MILEFSRGRGQQAPRQRLERFEGAIPDRRLRSLPGTGTKRPALRRIVRLARRGFYQALKESVTEAVRFNRQIRQLYGLEDQIRRLDPAER